MMCLKLYRYKRWHPEMWRNWNKYIGRWECCIIQAEPPCILETKLPNFQCEREFMKELFPEVLQRSDVSCSKLWWSQEHWVNLDAFRTFQSWQPNMTSWTKGEVDVILVQLINNVTEILEEFSMYHFPLQSFHKPVAQLLIRQVNKSVLQSR